ncbi:MAG: protein-disulfide reductase DsbD [Candidatus Competibacter sp.]|nr:protein-disulfide reductase DsbD [Candidatus Competibacter sp.]
MRPAHRQLWLLPAALLTLLALLAEPVAAGLFNRFGGSSQERVLDADEAFQLVVDVLNPSTVEARWTIAPGYYLYRSKFRLKLVENEKANITALDIPVGEPKDDPYLGQQEVFHREATLVAHLHRDSLSEQTVQIRADYQGCAEVGVCYPPLSQTVAIVLPALSAAAATVAPSPPPPVAAAAARPETALATTLASPSPSGVGPTPAESREAEPDRLARLLGERRFWAIPAFLGFGLLLAFTPCVFPMIPILSSLIVGQGASLTRRKAILLSLTYVLAMATTYTVAGLLAALLGQNTQAWFQSPWVLGFFSILFLLLALSMFGLYDLQLPTRLQNRLVDWSNRQRGGHHVGVAIMGLLSALIVSPCVAPPLIGALTFIAVTGDLVLGGAALFALSLGMGVPLLIIGASAGHWLPHAGHWMERIKLVFGVLLLAVALWLLERILPPTVTMVLWATLLIVTATYMGALQPIGHGAPPWRTLVKGFGLVLLIYGILLLVGVAAGGRDPWQPLRGVGLIANAASPTKPLSFRGVKTVEDVDQALRSAAGRPVLLDFYADWCVSCKEMERYTFSDPEVQAVLARMIPLQADVTANDTADRDLLKHFGIVGPPASVFFGSDGRERREYRVVGFVEAKQFGEHLRSLE